MLKQIEARLTGTQKVTAATSAAFIAVVAYADGPLTVGTDCARLTKQYASLKVSVHVLPGLKDDNGMPLVAIIGATEAAVRKACQEWEDGVDHKITRAPMF